MFGLHCADCAANVEKVLLSQEGVSSATVSAVTGNAQIRFDSKRHTREELLAAVAQLGYRTELLPESATDVRLLIALRGAHPAAAVAILEKTPGVSGVSVRGGGTVVAVDYDPAVLGPRTVLQLVQQGASEAQLLRGPSTAQAEAFADVLRWRKYFFLSLLLSLPCLFLAYIVPLVPPFRRFFERPLRPGISWGILISWAFSTPVQFVLGAPLYASAYRGLVYARQANMDLLVMLSTTTAYLYSFISCIIAFALSDETIGMLLCFLLLLLFLKWGYHLIDAHLAFPPLLLCSAQLL